MVDPNKTVDLNGVARERQIHHENLVMYANLEATNVFPRTKLAVGAPINDAVQNVPIAAMNFLRPGGKTLLTNAYLELIARKKRATVLMEIISAFIDQYKKHNNITTATIISAVKLDDASRKKALSIVKADSNGEVELIEKVDAELIGGFVIRVGDRQVDTSVARQLLNLKKNFNTKSVSIN